MLCSWDSFFSEFGTVGSLFLILFGDVFFVLSFCLLLIQKTFFSKHFREVALTMVVYGLCSFFFSLAVADMSEKV